MVDSDRIVSNLKRKVTCQEEIFGAFVREVFFGGGEVPVVNIQWNWLENSHFTLECVVPFACLVRYIRPARIAQALNIHAISFSIFLSP